MSFHSLSNPFIPLSWRGTEKCLSVNSFQFHYFKSGNIPHFTLFKVATGHYSFLFSLVISLTQRNSISFFSLILQLLWRWNHINTRPFVALFFCSQFDSVGSQRGCGVTAFATEALPPVGESQPWFPTAGGAGGEGSEGVIKMSVLHHFKAQSCLVGSVTLVLCAKGTFLPFGPQAALVLIRLIQTLANKRVM